MLSQLPIASPVSWQPTTCSSHLLEALEHSHLWQNPDKACAGQTVTPRRTQSPDTIGRFFTAKAQRPFARYTASAAAAMPVNIRDAQAHSLQRQGLSQHFAQNCTAISSRRHPHRRHCAAVRAEARGQQKGSRVVRGKCFVTRDVGACRDLSGQPLVCAANCLRVLRRCRQKLYISLQAKLINRADAPLAFLLVPALNPF